MRKADDDLGAAWKDFVAATGILKLATWAVLGLAALVRMLPKKRKRRW